jgi:hypothetical protein
MARLDPKPCPGNWELNSNITSEQLERPLNELLEISKRVDLLKTLVGVVVKFLVADGYAYYRVIKDTPFTIQHIPFCDAYKIHPATIQGLRNVDVLSMANAERQFESLLICPQSAKEHGFLA